MDYQIDSQLAQEFQQALSADDARDNPMLRRSITVETAEKLGAHWTNDFRSSPRTKQSLRREVAKATKFLRWKFYERASWKTE